MSAGVGLVAGARAGSDMMMRFSKMRPGLLVCSGLRTSRHSAVRRSTRPLLPNEVIGLAGARVDRGQVAGVQIEQPAVDRSALSQ